MYVVNKKPPYGNRKERKKNATIEKTPAKKTKKSDIKPYRLGNYVGIGYHSGTTCSGDKWEQRVANAIIERNKQSALAALLQGRDN